MLEGMALVQLHVLSWRFLKWPTKDVGAALEIEYLSQYSDKVVGRDSVVGISDSLRAARCGDRTRSGRDFPNPSKT